MRVAIDSFSPFCLPERGSRRCLARVVPRVHGLSQQANTCEYLHLTLQVDWGRSCVSLSTRHVKIVASKPVLMLKIDIRPW